MKERIHVKLKVDLTRYMKGLVAGTEGYTIGNYDIWSHANDNFYRSIFSRHWPDFKPVEFDWFKKLAGLNSLTLTIGQWIEKTNAVAIIS